MKFAGCMGGIAASECVGPPQTTMGKEELAHEILVKFAVAGVLPAGEWVKLTALEDQPGAEPGPAEL